MSDDIQTPPLKVNPLNAWFLSLDENSRGPYISGRFRILLLSFSLFTLLSLNLVATFDVQGPLGSWLQASGFWVNAIALLVLFLLIASIWRELLDPLLRLCNWAELMRGVNLDAQVHLRNGSDFTELANDINMLGKMINQLSRKTEIQLEKHTDYISRESRSLATLYEVASSINISNDLHELFEKTLASLCNNLNASAGIIRQFKNRNRQEVVASLGNLNHTFLTSTDHFLPLENLDINRQKTSIYRIDTLKNATVFSPDVVYSQDKLLVLSVLMPYREGILGVIHLFFPDQITLDLDEYNDLLLSIGQHLGSAAEKFRLIAEENELLIIQERTRLSHELHDSLAQTIASLRIQIRVIDETFHTDDEKAIWHQMERIEYTVDEANNQLRELIAHFRVPMNEQGLIPSIEEVINRTKEEAGIPIYFQNEWPPRDFPAEVEINVLRIVQECLANVRKHSQANVVRVLLTTRAANNVVLIEDDGIGFEESEIRPESGRQLGLNILRDRARQINGSIDIESEPGDGTRIHLEFELPEDTAQGLAG